MNEKLAPADAAGMLPYVDLVAITPNEIGGRRLRGEDSGESKQDLEAFVRCTDVEVEARLRMVVTTEDAQILADISATYRLSEPMDLPQETLRDFLERVAVMAIFPYLRETISSTASRLMVTAPVLGILRQGEFKLSDAKTDS